MDVVEPEMQQPVDPALDRRQFIVSASLDAGGLAIGVVFARTNTRAIPSSTAVLSDATAGIELSDHDLSWT